MIGSGTSVPTRVADMAGLPINKLPAYEVCPSCGSDQIVGHSYDQAGDTLTQHMTCIDCDNEWYNHFKYDRTTSIEQQLELEV